MKKMMLTLVLAIAAGVWTMSKAQEVKLNSLCDEWNIAKISGSTSLHEEIHTVKATLGADTIIESLRYAKLFEEGIYKGALREGLYHDIYYIPGGSTHEYLLYKFNANVGDTLSNLWTGGSTEWFPNGHNATVLSISEGTPKVFTVEVEYILSDSDGDHIHPRLVDWTEGVGMSDGPVGMPCTAPYCACSCGQVVLCAYKDSEQIYTSELGKKYGCEYNGEETPDPMFPSDTRWHYVYTEMYGGPDFTPIYFSDSPIDTVINNTHYQRIKGKLFRSEGAKVWCAKDSMGTLVERLVYDFDLQVGDSIRNIFYEDDPYDVIPSYAKVTKVENITLSDGRSARRLSYDAFRYDDIEHIGSLDGFLAPLNLPVSTCGCGDHFQCCTRGDVLLYEVSKGACDTFFVNNDTIPSDTIPLFIKDGPGTSTIDPVDPNLIYALLQGELLTIKDFSGAEIFCTLVNTTIPSNSPHHVRLQAQPFRDSLSVEITDAGLYEINLTSEAWNYSIYGSFIYGIKEGISLSTPEQPSAQKFVRNGQILIRRGDKTYTLTGQEIK